MFTVCVRGTYSFVLEFSPQTTRTGRRPVKGLSVGNSLMCLVLKTNLLSLVPRPSVLQVISKRGSQCKRKKSFCKGHRTKKTRLLLSIIHNPSFSLSTNLSAQGWFGSRLVANEGTSIHFHLLNTLLTPVRRGGSGRRRRTQISFPPHRSEPERNRKDTKYAAI